MREWLVIQDSRANGIFVPDKIRERKNYIPRDVAEKLLGRDLSGNQWFTREESALMRRHPEWRDTDPRATPESSG
jgi:hypothetical protein